MDDLILFTPSKESHINKLEDILSALLKNGLKVSPKKCQLFKTGLQYMGNEIFIEKKGMCETIEKQVRSNTKNYSHLRHPRDVEALQDTYSCLVLHQKIYSLPVSIASDTRCF